MTIRGEEEEETKLHVAARLNNVRLLRAALREGLLGIDAVGIAGWTALHQAASCGYLEITIALLENGANPNIQDDQKCAPIHLAARSGHLEVVRSLCRSGARLDLRNAEGRMPQDCGNDECRAFLERQRTRDVIKLSPSPVEGDHSLRKIYGPKSSQSPVLKKKVRQSSPQWSESSQSSQESMSSTSSGSSESFSGSSNVYHPGPGEIRVSFDYNHSRQSLLIYVGEIRDVKLPADHNMSHVYVKGYLIPDRNKSTKRKTALHKLQRIDAKERSNDNVTSWNGEAEREKPRERRMSQRLASTLKRGTRSSQKKKGQDHAPQNLVPVYRISTLYGEYFRYDAADLRKVDIESCTVLLTVSGRNRVTTQGQPIACLSLPLSSYANMTTAEWYPLKYKILLPSGYDVAEDMQSMRGSKSWEEKGGKYAGRSLAWNGPTMSMSMPNIDFTASSAPQRVQRVSLGGEGGFPANSSRMYKKHSGAERMSAKESNNVQGKGNYRYRKSSSKQDYQDQETVVDSFGERSATIPGAGRAGSDLNRTLREQNRDIADLPRNRIHGDRKNTASNLDLNDYERPNGITEVISLEDEEPSSRPEMEHRSSFAGSLKYSRAFQQNASAARRRDMSDDMDVEDFEDVTDTPFAVNKFHGRKNGIACN